jgi:hypothetical protein
VIGFTSREVCRTAKGCNESAAQAVYSIRTLSREIRDDKEAR